MSQRAGAETWQLSDNRQCIVLRVNWRGTRQFPDNRNSDGEIHGKSIRKDGGSTASWFWFLLLSLSFKASALNKTNFFNALQVGLTEFVGIHLKKNTDCSKSQYSLTHRLKAIAVTREECEKLQFDAQASCFKERLWRERSMHAIVDLSSQYLLGRCHGTQRFNSTIGHVLYEV